MGHPGFVGIPSDEEQKQILRSAYPICDLHRMWGPMRAEAQDDAVVGLTGAVDDRKAVEAV